MHCWNDTQAGARVTGVSVIPKVTHIHQHIVKKGTYYTFKLYFPEIKDKQLHHIRYKDFEQGVPSCETENFIKLLYNI